MISAGEKRAASLSICTAASRPEKAVAWVWPVEMSQAAKPAHSPSSHAAAQKLLRPASKEASSSTVPGVTTRMMSRFTSPLAVAGSSVCSQMATL